MIRKAEISDYKDMDEVFRASVKALCASCYDKDTIEAWAGKPWPDRFVQGVDEGNEQYVAVLQNKVVCFGALNIDKQVLVSLFVAPEHAGQGIAQQMIDYIFSRAKEAGINTLRLDSSLNAIKFYAKNGFMEQGRSEFKTQNGVIMESVQMECNLCA